MLSLRSILTLVFAIAATAMMAQSSTIKGKLIDKESGEVLMFAAVQVKQNGVLIKGATTDFDGNYVVKPLDPGTYDVIFSYFGYATKVVKGFSIGADKIETLNARLVDEALVVDGVDIVYHKKPLVTKGTEQTVTADDIEDMPTMDLGTAQTTQGAVGTTDDGDAINAGGARSDANVTYVNGIRVIGNTGVPLTAVKSMTIVDRGVPARYGDATGMIVNITTKGISSNVYGGISALSSQLTDPYGYNLIEANVGGPLKFKYDKVTTDDGVVLKAKDGTDSLKKGEAVLGFLLAGRAEYQLDQDPSAVGVWRLTDSMYNELRANPLVASSTGAGNQMAANYYTAEHFENVKVKDNNQRMNATLRANVEYNPGKNVKLAFGGAGRYQRRNSWIRNYSLLNYSENMPIIENVMLNGYGKITQWLTEDQTEEQKKSGVKPFFDNVYYTLQGGYTSTYRNYFHPRHKFNPFQYGHVGQFQMDRVAVLNDDFTFGGYGFANPTFNSGSANPILSNYTQAYYNNGGAPASLASIQTGGGLINGDDPQNVLGIYSNIGALSSTYFYVQENQTMVQLVANMDLNFKRIVKDKDGNDKNQYYPHAVEFGFEYQTRERSSYQFLPSSLWTRMRQITNSHIDLSGEDIQGAVNFDGFVIPNFTYQEEVANLANQGNFDRNLRIKLGMDPDASNVLNIDNLAPETFSLDMFSAEELISQGSNSLVEYQGYDYLGNKLNSTPTFAGYWTEKDDQGNYTRDIAAYNPIYTSFFVQDKFDVDKLNFSVGLRVDRFDANHKVLRDAYNIYGQATAGDRRALNTADMNGAFVPSNIQDDYAIYGTDVNMQVDDASYTIAGYRNGDVWYDANGVVVSNPEVIAQLSNTGSIAPTLLDPNEDIKTENYSVDNAFEDYKAAWSFMPRILFNFELKKDAMFFASYDVLTMRPVPSTAINMSLPYEYMFMRELNNITTFNNANLRPEQTIDYSVGFKQALGEYSAITVETFYREMRNMINMVRINYAYPISYTTYGNIDFTTVKGLTLTYDLRAKRNFGMVVNYTLQFADGTGSSVTSASGILNSDQPNLRTIFPLDFDQRHNIVGTMSYKFKEGRDYGGLSLRKIDENGDTTKVQILKNVQVSSIVRLGSGRPYSRTQQPIAEAELTPGRSNLLGSMNGSRLPWTTKIDLKVEKKFSMFQKKRDDGTKDMMTGLDMKLYLQVLNLFDARNIVNVYSYTGNAEDDGFLSSSLGQEKAATFEEQGTQESYINYYSMKVMNPSNFTMPRRTRIGLVINF